MEMNYIHAIGFLAQGLFTSRFIVQWISSEKAGKVLAPTLFWKLSLIASFLLILYGILIKDISIILGQTLGFYVYIANLRWKNKWDLLPTYFRYLIGIVPLIAIAFLAFSKQYNIQVIWESQSSFRILLWGIIGQAIFSTRFLYQWYYSNKRKNSFLPVGFWIISIVGSIIISSYSIYLELYPIIIGHIFGLVVYSRNIMIHRKRV